MKKYSSFTLTLIKFEKGEEICLCKTSEVKKFGNDTISEGFVIKENGEVGQIKSIYKGEANKFLVTQNFSTPIEKVRPLSLEDILNLQAKKDITTKEELVELIKKNFRDGFGVTNLRGLDFSGEVVDISGMKAKSLHQNEQEVENNLFQSWQKVGGCLHQQYQEVKGKVFQDEPNKDQCETNKDITTKEELVELIKKNFRDEAGSIDLNDLDFSGEVVAISGMKAKKLYQSYQKVGLDLYQHHQKVGLDLYQYSQTVGNNLYQQYQEVESSLFQNSQKVGNNLCQYEQTVKGEIFQDETNTDPSETNTDQDETKRDNINPNYYKGKIECINAIEEITKDLQGVEAVATGTAIKYLWRWKNKNGVEDLKKAQWYINRLIEINKAKSRK